MTIDASIAVVIVNYGAADFIIRHLTKTLDELAAFRDGRVYIADNASPNGDLETLQRFIAEQGLQRSVTAFATGGNFGFAGGNNAAFARFETPPDVVLFLNPDAYPSPGALRRLYETLIDDDGLAIVGPRLVDESGQTSISYYGFPSLFGAFGSELESGRLTGRDGWRMRDLDAEPAVFETDWVSGAVFLLRMSAATVPPMDDGYFLYFEETDMMRALAREGWRIALDPRAVFTHVGGLTTNAGVAKAPLPQAWYDSWRRYHVKEFGRAGAVIAGLAKFSGILAYRAKMAWQGRKPHRFRGYGRAFFQKALLPVIFRGRN